MSREVKRVPTGFRWPLNKVWKGYLMPDRFNEVPCEQCEGSGYAPHARHLHCLWYGYVPFRPASTGSARLHHTNRAVRELAERNVARAPEYYGSGDEAVLREACRLADLWNGQWAHHLSQEDVDALAAAGRLTDFTHTWSRETGWRPADPPVKPAAADVNAWSLRGMGHDSINASVAIRARCEREGFEVMCPQCDGHGSAEAYEGQRAEAEAWTRTEPPEGDGWQLWETVSEGSPISPVFAYADELAGWMSDPARGEDRVPVDVAANFIREGWAPTLIGDENGVVSGVEAIGMRAGTEER